MLLLSGALRLTTSWTLRREALRTDRSFPDGIDLASASFFILMARRLDVHRAISGNAPQHSWQLWHSWEHRIFKLRTGSGS